MITLICQNKDIYYPIGYKEVTKTEQIDINPCSLDDKLICIDLLTMSTE